MKRALFAVAAAAILGGCADPGGNSGEGYVEKEYRVGSNLPVRRGSAADGVSTMSGEDLERARNGSSNPGSSVPPPRPGGR